MRSEPGWVGVQESRCRQLAQPEAKGGATVRVEVWPRRRPGAGRGGARRGRGGSGGGAWQQGAAGMVSELRRAGRATGGGEEERRAGSWRLPLSWALRTHASLLRFLPPHPGMCPPRLWPSRAHSDPRSLPRAAYAEWAPPAPRR